ncbi:DUF1989 domain-containing protein [Martelella endophytica]|uniref:DUF1989 domain-containing protein n=1 Tax=Martelella endophytica TaxID=1486262 RepID=A0A0D5LLH8_MAREN|nr:urea carboxylase-associated family protein [Martelella endophytica]AJY45044.1 hypothetical protein TM49_04030 [Martelella endophytica]
MTDIVDVTKVPARQGRMIALNAGDMVDVVNTHGGQVVDTWAFSRDNPAEYMSMEHSHVLHYRLNFKPGDALCTDAWRTIMTFVEDTSPGIHDTLCPACCEPSYNIFYGHKGYHANCSDNLKGQFEKLGVPFHRVPTPWNLFMETIVENNNTLRDMPSTTKRGQYVRLRAEMDCYFAVSACPQDLIVINGEDGVPRDIELHVHRAKSST